MFGKNKSNKEYYGRDKVCNAAAEVIKNGGDIIAPGRRHHKALAAGSDNAVKLCFKPSVFLNEHYISNSEGDEFVSGKKTEDKMSPFVDDCLDKICGKNKDKTKSNMKDKSSDSVSKHCVKIGRDHHKKSANSAYGHIKEVGDEGVAFFVVQLKSTAFHNKYII